MGFQFWLRKVMELGKTAGPKVDQAEVPTKACVAAGCLGTMSLQDPLDAIPRPSHFEFPRCATWVCVLDPAHTELVSLNEWYEIRLAHPRRRQ
jgi:hypothetical protein